MKQRPHSTQVLIAFLIFSHPTLQIVRSENLLLVNCDEKMPPKKKLRAEKGQKTLFGTVAAEALVAFFLLSSVYLSICLPVSHFLSFSLFLLPVSGPLLQQFLPFVSLMSLSRKFFYLFLSLSLTHSLSYPLFLASFHSL